MYCIVKIEAADAILFVLTLSPYNESCHEKPFILHFL